MTDRIPLLKQIGWTVLSACLSLAGLMAVVPSVRSEQVGVIWPSEERVVPAAVLILFGLAVSGRAGRGQYVVFALLAAGFAVYVLGLRSILTVSGIVGIG